MFDYLWSILNYLYCTYGPKKLFYIKNLDIFVAPRYLSRINNIALKKNN